MAIPTITIISALELIRYIINSRNLAGKTPEEILALWAQTNVDAKAAIDAWNATQAPPPRPDA